MILAESPNGAERALSACKDALQGDSHGRLSITQPLFVLLWLGWKAEVVRACRGLEENPFEDFHPVHRKRSQQNLDYLCGRMSAEEFLQSAGASRLRLCEVHFYIGLKRLATGDRAAAVRHLRQSVGTHVYMYFEYQYSRIFLQRLEEDPTWPPWIPVKEEGAVTQPQSEPEGDTEGG
jgi:hypothetical protein